MNGWYNELPWHDRRLHGGALLLSTGCADDKAKMEYPIRTQQYS